MHIFVTDNKILYHPPLPTVFLNTFERGYLSFWRISRRTVNFGSHLGVLVNIIAKMATESEPKNLSEMSEEEKFRAKFPGRKPTTTDVMRKRLQKGGVKYFDSGDYAMAKSSEKKGPIPHRPNLDVLGVGRGIPTPDKIPHRKSSVPSKLVEGQQAHVEVSN